MKLKIVLSALCLLFLLQSSAQLQNAWWYVGQGSGLKFEVNGLQQLDSTVMGFDDGSTTVSDSLGNLLFYTNGVKLYNRLHQPMFGNSDLPTMLSGHSPGPADSLTIGSALINAVLAFNVPGSTSKYYLFTFGVIGIATFNNRGLYYQVIDMNLDGGLGGVELPKNRIAHYYHLGGVSRKLAGIRHANGRDWWLIAIDNYINTQTGIDSTGITRILFTPEGISDSITTMYSNVYYPGLGEISVSYDGSKLVFGGNSYLYMTDFDRCSGNVGAITKLDSVVYDLEAGNIWFGVSFAPHRKDLLYGGTPRYLYQYLLDTITNLPISRQTVHFNSTYCVDALVSCYFMGQLQQGIDGKIYQMVNPQNYWDIPLSDTLSRKIRVIENSDSIYPACNYSYTPAILHNPNMPGLPNQVDWKLGRLIGSECDTITTVFTNHIKGDELAAVLFPNPAKDEVTLVLSKPALEEMSLLLFDVLGKKVLQTEIPRHKKYVDIDVSELNEGVYYYQLSDEKKNVISGKLVVQR